MEETAGPSAACGGGRRRRRGWYAVEVTIQQLIAESEEAKESFLKNGGWTRLQGWLRHARLSNKRRVMNSILILLGDLPVTFVSKMLEDSKDSAIIHVLEMIVEDSCEDGANGGKARRRRRCVQVVNHWLTIYGEKRRHQEGTEETPEEANIDPDPTVVASKRKASDGGAPKLPPLPQPLVKSLEKILLVKQHQKERDAQTLKVKLVEVEGLGGTTRRNAEETSTQAGSPPPKRRVTFSSEVDMRVFPRSPPSPPSTYRPVNTMTSHPPTNSMALEPIPPQKPTPPSTPFNARSIQNYPMPRVTYPPPSYHVAPTPFMPPSPAQQPIPSPMDPLMPNQNLSLATDPSRSSSPNEVPPPPLVSSTASLASLANEDLQGISSEEDEPLPWNLQRIYLRERVCGYRRRSPSREPLLTKAVEFSSEDIKNCEFSTFVYDFSKWRWPTPKQEDRRHPIRLINVKMRKPEQLSPLVKPHKSPQSQKRRKLDDKMEANHEG